LENKDSTTALYSVVSKDSRINLVVPVSPFPLAAESHGKLPLFFNFDASILNDGKVSSVLEISDKNGFKQELKIELLGPG
jgi:hypothetical protein